MRWVQGVVWAGILLWVSLGPGVAAETVPDTPRLVQALGFMQQGAWQQAVEAIGELDGRAALTPGLARLCFSVVLWRKNCRILKQPGRLLNGCGRAIHPWRTMPRGRWCNTMRRMICYQPCRKPSRLC